MNVITICINFHKRYKRYPSLDSCRRVSYLRHIEVSVSLTCRFYSSESAWVFLTCKQTSLLTGQHIFYVASKRLKCSRIISLAPNFTLHAFPSTHFNIQATKENEILFDNINITFRIALWHSDGLISRRYKDMLS